VIYSTLFGDGVNRNQILMALVLIFTIRCSYFQKPQVSPRAKGEVAVLQTSSSIDVFVYSIDEKRVAQGDDIRYELEPGVHTITLRFRKQKTTLKRPGSNRIEFDLSIDAKAGKTYQIEFIKDIDHSTWSTCIIDALNKNRVSSIITNKD
jgi:plastocyanin